MAEGPKPINKARSLRKRTVPAEALLWRALRNRALGGFKFRRQHPVGPYVVDFACAACRIVVEVDGETHLSRSRADAQRTAHIEAEGWRVLRFWNTEVYDELDAVKEAIYRQCVSQAGST
jgi:very-short-patch-repair endonuclease